MAWADDVAAADDFKVAPFRADGVTPGTPIWVWAVALDGGVFVRSANPGSRWFTAAVAQRAGIVVAGGVRHRVAFEHVTDEPLRDRVDAAFAGKYAADPYLTPDVLRRSRPRIARITPSAEG